MPKTGPSEGWRMEAIVRAPTRFRAIESPMVVVVLPSPSGVGVIAVTSMYLPFGRSASRFMTESATFALVLPWSSSSSSSRPSERAISAMGRSVARWAISRSESILGFSASPLDLHRAHLVLRDLGRGVVGRVGEEVGGGIRELHERHEDGAAADGLGEPRVAGQFATRGGDPDGLARLDAELPGV